MPRDSRESRDRRRATIVAHASAQGGVLSSDQLSALGVTWSQHAEILAGRWERVGDQCIQVGPTDRTTALLAAGLRTVADEVVHVAAPKSRNPRSCPGVRVHETRRYRAEDVVRVGIPRMKPATAAVHAALWARTDREAALLVTAPVQQRIVAVHDLAEAISLITRDKRRSLLRGLLIDLTEGLEALGEQDFARACRRRGFPKPSHQDMRVLPSGRVYYDVVWAQYRVRAEIHGAQHLDVAAAARDALKANASALEGLRLIVIPNHAFRADSEPFLDQIEVALRAGGWKRSRRPPLTA